MLRRFETPLRLQSTAGRALQRAVLPFPASLTKTAMQRVTLTLDDELLATLDALSEQRGYNNRSGGARYFAQCLMHEHAQKSEQRGYAVLSTCTSTRSASWRAG